MMATQKHFEQVKEIVGKTLKERFGNEFVFDPIEVRPDIDEYGEEYLRIMIIFDGDQRQLDPRWTSGLITRIRPKLIEAGVEEFPSPSFIEKSEWQRLYRKPNRASA